MVPIPKRNGSHKRGDSKHKRLPPPLRSWPLGRRSGRFPPLPYPPPRPNTILHVSCAHDDFGGRTSGVPKGNPFPRGLTRRLWVTRFRPGFSHNCSKKGFQELAGLLVERQTRKQRYSARLTGRKRKSSSLKTVPMVAIDCQVPPPRLLRTSFAREKSRSNGVSDRLLLRFASCFVGIHCSVTPLNQIDDETVHRNRNSYVSPHLIVTRFRAKFSNNCSKSGVQVLLVEART